jgi:hypothetical protein
MPLIGIGRTAKLNYNLFMSAQISDISAATDRPRGRPWAKGISGNPGGRPKAIADLVALARQQTPNALKVLASLMEDINAPASARVAAAKEILDRGWGRSQSSVSVSCGPSLEDVEIAQQLHCEMMRHIEIAELSRQSTRLSNKGSSR